MLNGMSLTTIKLDTETRDRLSAVARKRDLTLGELVLELTQKAEEEEYWRDIHAAYARLQREDPAGWDDYLAELSLWENANDGVWADHRAAREEYPEYNP
jgi:hypothetical protein